MFYTETNSLMVWAYNAAYLNSDNSFRCDVRIASELEEIAKKMKEFAEAMNVHSETLILQFQRKLEENM